MNKNRFMSAVPTGDPYCLSLVDNKSNRVIVQYRVSKSADFLENAELTKKIMTAYEEYYKSVAKKLDD